MPPLPDAGEHALLLLIEPPHQTPNPFKLGGDLGQLLPV
jgi:hypothetical protein